MRYLLIMLCICLPAVHYSQLLNRIQERRAERQQGTASSSPAYAPVYEDLYYWAAHPFKQDAADKIPTFLKNEQRDTSVDVFFIHPTSFTKDMQNAAWNADVNDSVLNKETDNRTIQFQASVFNASCRVFAPRYRQAHLKAFFSVGQRDKGKEALALAYSDVKAAFEYYLQHWNNGRPIIIASHSQGTAHAIQLLKDFFDGTELQQQLVSAYIIGFQVKPDAFKQLKPSTSPTATGGFISWRTFVNGQVDRITEREKGGSICINPITWTDNTNWSDTALFKGAILQNFNFLMKKPPVSATISKEHNILWVKLPEGMPTPGIANGNLHIADYNLFYMNIRENVKERIAAYKATHK